MSRTRDDDLLATRLEGLRRSLTLTDRVLSGREVTLKFNMDAGAYALPAFSMGNRIELNLSAIPDLGSNAALVLLLGLNYHEVGHVRYSVDVKTILESVPYSQHARFSEAYRVLEEARVETLLAAKYAKMRKYFAYPVIEHFVKDRRTWPTAFLYVHGRRYLPLRIRQTFSDIFAKEYGGNREFAEVIDNYRVISFTDRKELNRAALLVNKFASLMDKYKIPELEDEESHDSTMPDREEKSDKLSSSDTKEEVQIAASQTADQDEKEKKGEDGSEFDEEEEDDGDSGDESESEEGDGEESEGSGGGDGEAEDDAKSSSGSSSDGKEDDGDQKSGRGSRKGKGGKDKGNDNGKSSPQKGESSPGGSGAGGKGLRSRHVPSQAELNQKLRELQGDMSDALEKVLADQDVQNDVDNLKSAMDGEAGLNSSLDRHERSNDKNLQPVTPEMLSEADRLKDPLRQIWAQMEAGWNYGLSEGNRIDMSRAALAQSADDYDSIYADWQEGQQDNSGLEVVIVADESGSMDEPVPIPEEFALPRNEKTKKVTVVSKQIWELLYAFQEVDAHVTVITYEGQSRTMYTREDRVTTKGYAPLWARGGTEPSDALREAKRILNNSTMPNKLLVCITDGQWSTWGGDDYATDLDEINAVKVAALIDSSGSGYEFHMANKFHVVKRTNGPIFDVVAEAAIKIVERNVER